MSKRDDSVPAEAGDLSQIGQLLLDAKQLGRFELMEKLVWRYRQEDPVNGSSDRNKSLALLPSEFIFKILLYIEYLI